MRTSRLPLLAFAILGAAILQPLPASARRKPVRVAKSKPAAPERRISLEGVDTRGQVVPCPLRDTSVTSDISGFVARVTVKQRFSNPSKTPIEALYTFPLPADAAVDQMSMTIGNRRVVGVVKRKEEARAVYETAKKAGKTAALLDQERPNIFTQSVANIMPGQDIVVEIGYTNVLKYEDGVYEWAFPTVVGPRYTARGGYEQTWVRGSSAAAPAHLAKLESSERDPEKITPPIAGPGQHAGHTLFMQVNLNAGVSLREVKSVLHPIEVQRQGWTKAVVTLKEGQTVPDRDFVLRYKAGGESVETGVLTQNTNKGGHFTVVFQPPLQPTQGQIAKREMVYVIDQTGSQSGFPVEKSKETIRAALKRLNPGDTFNLIGFNTDVYPCFPAPVPVTQDNIEKANTYLNGINAEGGTDILRSMDYVLKQPADPARLRVVAYFTDGYVGNDMQIVDFIKKNRGTTRIFPFGIGNSVNRFLIEQMAKEGRGAYQIVTLEDEGKKAANDFIKRLQRPLLLNPSVEFNGLPVEEVYPKVLPDMFAEGPLVIHGRYTKPAKGTVTVKGYFEGKPWRQDIPVDFPAVAKDNPAIPSLWARAKIEDIQSQDWDGAQNGSPKPDIKEAIVKTALAYQLMSQFTSFVAVEQRIVNPGGKSALADTPVEMANGVRHSGIFGEAAAKAAAAPAPPSRTARRTGRTRLAKAPRSNYAMGGSGGGGGFAAQPGDPLIFVQAPESAVQVIALLPSGEIKKLEWSAERGGWQGRFDIPGYTDEDKQIVTVIIVNRDGSRKRVQLFFRVDTKAPSGEGQLQDNGNGWTLTVAGEADTNRVEAILPWGERLTLPKSGEVYESKVVVPTDWIGKAAKATVVLTDNAHNRTTIELDLSE